VTTLKPRQSGKSLHWLVACLVGAALCIAIVLSYWPGLHGPFVFDDAENITANPPVALRTLNATTIADALLANDAGPLKRPLASLTFALNHYFAGGFESAFPFKATNLAIHVINSWIVYALVFALMGVARDKSEWSGRDRAIFAWLCASVWALHPIQITSVLYVVQRMTSLAGTFVLAGLWAFVYGRSQLAEHPARATWWMTAGLVGGTLLGITVKEPAALLPLYALAIEFSFFRSNELKRSARRRLLFLYAGALAVPAVLFGGYLILQPHFFSESYATRTFTPLERLLTEARVLWHYIGLLLYPIPSHFGLFHDDIIPSTGLLTPPTTLLACLAWVVTATTALAVRDRHPLPAFSILWFLAGHSLESSFFGLELAHEHRNYLPSLGPILLVAAGICQIGARLFTGDRGKILVAGTVASVLAFSTWVRSTDWSSLSELAFATARHHPDSPRANDFAARVALGDQHDVARAIAHTLHGLKLQPDEAGFHLDLQLLLAIQAREMDSFLNQHAGNNEGRGRIEIQIAGLDERFNATRSGGLWVIQHPASTDEQLRQLLSTRTLSVHAVVALETARHCATQTPTPCEGQYDRILGWHVAAAGNPHTSRTYRGVIASGAARLAAARDNYESALNWIRRARTFSPDELAYQIGEAEYLIRLGQLTAAEQVMSSIKHGQWSRAMVASNHANLEALERLWSERSGKTSR
jgi:hypothetical protein